jgi:bile acid:Na+ symporter, BASS family
MASSAFMLVLGLENSLALTLLVLGMLVAPVASPAFASLLAGAAVPISPLMLAEKLALFIGLGMVLGLLLRRLVGYARITALKPELDGTGVLLYFVFAIAAMDGVIDTTLRQPLFVLGLLALTAGIAALGFALTWGLARSFGFNDRFSLATSVAFRNMGLLMTPIFSLVPPTTFLYFALAQIPVYVGPMVLKAVKARLEPAPASDNA